ncbi:MAG: DUF177 domain-containing protein [Magnetococcales bacterium]|nr:DUF177 domain-containing protein [Magnetococcales bacterium]
MSESTTELMEQNNSRDLSDLTLEVEGKRAKSWRIVGMIPAGKLENVPEAEMVEVDLTANRLDNLVRVRGKLESRVRTPCSRCLESFAHPLEVDVTCDYRLGLDPNITPGERQIEDDTVFLTDGRLVLQRLVAEELLLDMPITPLCQADCHGLCPGCGINLNHQGCGCATPAEASGPFAGLKKLISDKQGSDQQNDPK